MFPFQDIKNGRFYLGDCLEVMKQIPDGCIDMILCDLPYGTTHCKWDSIIDLKLLWKEYERIVKQTGAIVLTSSQPFTSNLIISNMNLFKYQWVWDKKIPSGMGNTKYQPMRQHEDVCVFSKASAANGAKENMQYYPQKSIREKAIKSGGMTASLSAGAGYMEKLETKTYDDKHPTTILTFDKVRKGSVHPTQKPVALFEYLIKTYTNEGELVLDNCAGTGTTAIACENTNRRWICVEQLQEYADKAVQRILSNNS